MTGTDLAIEEGAMRFRADMAELVISWNQLEFAARYLLETLANVRSFEGQILTARMDGVQLHDALEALAITAGDVAADHIQHLLRALDRLRTWRNYVVHGIVGVAIREGEVVGYTQEIKVKKGLKYRQHTVSREELSAITLAIRRFNIYASAILGHVFERRGVNLLSYVPLTPEYKPPLPDELSASAVWFAAQPPPSAAMEKEPHLPDTGSDKRGL